MRKESRSFIDYRSCARLLLGVLLLLQVNGIVFGQGGGTFRIDTDTLPAGTVGTAYSQTFKSAGTSISPYTWSLASGSLPLGLTLTPGGVLTGIPTTAGTFNFTVRVVDSSSPQKTVQKAFTLVINPLINPLSLTTTSPLPAGTVGTSYTQTFTATGGTTPYTWSRESGSLPAGLTFTAGGILSGTPTAAGSFSFSIRVRDNGAVRSDEKVFTLTINPAITPIAISTGSPLPSGTVGTSYSRTLAATGGTSPYTWSLASGSLPVGLNLSSSGILSGTPTAEGSFNFTIRVTDGGTPQQNAQKAFSLTIVSVLTVTTNSTLPSGIVGTPYSQTLAANSGTSPFTWAITAGSLPAGVNLSASGTLSGTPTAEGSFNFTIRVTDGGTPQQNAQKTFSLTIVSGLTVTTNSTLPSGFVGTPYSQTLAATGGTPPYTWAVTAGSLPEGVGLSSSGTLSGTPAAAGSFSVTIRATDSGPSQQAVPKIFNLTIVSGLSITTSSPLSSGIVGTPYSQTLTATGGTPPYTWSLASGSLPAGVSLSSGGILGGTPTAEGSLNFTIRAMDSSTPQQDVQKAFNLTIISALSITTSSPLPSGIVGAPYSQTLAATGGTSPYTWALAAGTLPSGLTLSTGGILSGTPTAQGSFNFTIRVTDTAQQTAQKAFTLTVVPAGAPLSITTTSPLPSGIMGTRYSSDLQASGGTPPYRWTVRSGVPPQGLTLSSDGLLSGTPTSAGSFSFTTRVTDSSSSPQTADQTFGLTIDNPNLPSLTLTSVQGDLNPTQQQSIGLGLSAPYPAALSGILTISFTPNAVVAIDDPMVMFSNGSRTVSFSIPANSAVAVFTSPVLLLTGTVAGSISLNATLQGGQPQRIATVNVRSLPPQLRNVVGVRTPGGLRVEVTGYSPERRIQRVDFEFRLRTAAGTESASLGRSVEPEFDNWYRSPNSTAFGSSFLFMQSFVVQGDTTAIESVTITLTNAQGSTSSNVISFSN